MTAMQAMVLIGLACGGALTVLVLWGWGRIADEGELRPGGPDIRITPTQALADLDGVRCRVWRATVDGRPFDLFVYRARAHDSVTAELLGRLLGPAVPPPRNHEPSEN